MDARRQIELPTSARRQPGWMVRILAIAAFACGLLALYLWGHGRVDRFLRREVAIQLAAQFPLYRISLGHATIEQGRSLVLRDLVLRLPSHQGDREVLRIHRLCVAGNWDIDRILRSRTLPISSVDIDGADLWLFPWGDPGQWSLHGLMQARSSHPSLPKIKVRRGSLRLGGAIPRQSELMVAHDIDLEVWSSLDETNQQAVKPQPTFRVRFASGGGLAESLSGDALWSPGNQRLELTSQWHRLSITQKLWQTASEFTEGSWERLRAFEAIGDGTMQLAMEQGRVQDFLVQGTIEQGRYRDPLLQGTIESVQGQFHLTPALAQLRSVQARFGETTLELDLDRKGWQSNAPIDARWNLKKLRLDPNLAAALPAKVQETLQRLQLTGWIDAKGDVAFDGQHWHPEAWVQLHEGTMIADVFPYPVEQLAGLFHYRDGVVIAQHLTASANGQQLTGSIQMQRAEPKWWIDLELRSEAAVPITPPLLAALTPRGQPATRLESFVRSLHPQGRVHLKGARFRRGPEAPERLSKWIELQCFDGAIRYDRFQYPVFDIQGQVIVDNEVLILKDLQGRNDSARIVAQGRCILSSQRLDELQLQFDASDLPLEEELQRALPDSVRDLWEQVQPSGTLDSVQVKLSLQQPGEPLGMEVEIRETGMDRAGSGHRVTLRPLALPYLLHDVSCHLLYRPGSLDILQMKGYHETSLVKTEGSCRAMPDGTWTALLQWLPSTRVVVEPSFTAALPAALRSPLQAIDLQGPLSVDGWTQFRTRIDDRTPIAEAWDLHLDIEDGRMRGGQSASAIRGSVALQGHMTPEGPLAMGNLQIDSLAVRGVPVTNLRGDFAVEGHRLWFGRDAAAVQRKLQSLVRLGTSPSAVQPASAELLAQQSNSLVPDPSILAQNNLTQLASPPSTPHQEYWLGVPVSPNLPSPIGMLQNWPALTANPLERQDLFLPLQTGDLTANALGGHIHAFGVLHWQTGRIAGKAYLTDSEYAMLLRDVGVSGGEASGRATARLDLQGVLNHPETFSGQGSFHLRDASLYELPVMAKMFRTLSLKMPDEGAFETSDVLFRVDGDRIEIDHLSLDGDVIRLSGKGFTSLRRDLHLDLDAYVGGRGPLGMVLGPLVTHNESASLLHLVVDGTIDNPQIRRSIPGMETASP